MIDWSTKRRRRFACTAKFFRGDRGNIAPIFAILMIPIIGALGVATEASGWYFTQGSLQNAADAAALAAAANVTSSGATTQCTVSGDPCYEAKAVTARYGYADGANNVVVQTAANVACPSPLTTSDCYRVTITKLFPVRLLAVAGFRGDTQVGSARYQKITAVAVTQTGGASSSGCILALSTSAAMAVELKNNAELTDPNCGVYSNSTAADAIRVANNAVIDGPTYAVGGTSVANNGELNGTPNKTGVSAMSDPYADVVATPPATCTGGTAVKSVGNNGTLILSPNLRYCGGVSVGNNGTLDMSTSGVYYIDTSFSLGNNVTIKANPPDGVTIVVNGTYPVAFGNNITMQIVAPKTGPYAGIAIMGPRNGSDSTVQIFDNNGVNSITGAIYFPSQKIEFSNNAALTSTSCVQIIASKIYFKNNSFISGNCSGTGVKAIGAGARYVKLLQ